MRSRTLFVAADIRIGESGKQVCDSTIGCRVRRDSLAVIDKNEVAGVAEQEVSDRSVAIGDPLVECYGECQVPPSRQLRAQDRVVTHTPKPWTATNVPNANRWAVSKGASSNSTMPGRNTGSPTA